GSFVTLGSPLTAKLGGDFSGSGISVAAPQNDDQPEAQRSRPSGVVAAGKVPAIDWDSDRGGALDQLTSSQDSRDWLDDFLNHLGQNAGQRNPNAGIRVQPSTPSAAI